MFFLKKMSKILKNFEKTASKSTFCHSEERSDEESNRYIT